jgi:hypothetical protein
MEDLFSLDLAKEPRAFVFFDKESAEFAWAGKEDKRRLGVSTEALVLNSTIYGLLDVTMALARESVVHEATLEMLLGNPFPKIHGLAKVGDFNRREKAMKLLPLSLSA